MRETRRLHVHCVSGLPSHRPRGAGDLARYPERALLVAAEGDLVCLPAPPDDEHLDFLNQLGIGPAACDVLVPADGPPGAADLTLGGRLLADRALLGRIAASVPAGGVLELEPYATTPEILAVARALESAGAARVRVRGGTAEAAELADRKHVVRARAIELGVPVASGEVVELAVAGGRRRRDLEPVREAIGRQLPHTGRVIVRGSAGAGGSSTFVVESGGDDAEEVIHRIAGRGDNRVYLVEALVDLTVSPNLHLSLDGRGGVTRVAATDQRWGRPLMHAGNVYPSNACLLEPMEQWARTMAEWLGREGYAGDVGFDFVEYRDARGVPAAFLAEVNPRTNAAGYPLALRARLNAARRGMGRGPLAAFASGTLRTRARSFSQMREALGELLFSHETGLGLVPYVTGCLEDGRCPAVALAPSRREALGLHAEAQAALEASWAGR